MPNRLLSPNRRRLVEPASMSILGITQLRRCGWTDYDGPATVTDDPRPALQGWIIPGSDPALDGQRAVRTGTYDLK